MEKQVSSEFQVYEAIVLHPYTCEQSPSFLIPYRIERGQKVRVLKQEKINGWSFVVPFGYNNEHDPKMVPRGWVPTAYLSENLDMKQALKNSGSKQLRAPGISVANGIIEFSEQRCKKDLNKNEKNSDNENRNMKSKVKAPPPPPKTAIVKKIESDEELKANLADVNPPVGEQQTWVVYKQDLDSLLSKTQRNFPLVCYVCLAVILKKGLSQEGIFRISARKIEIDSIKEQIDKDEMAALQIIEKDDPDLASGLFKRFLRELPSGIMENDLDHACVYSIFVNILKEFKSGEFAQHLKKFSPSFATLGKKLKEHQKSLGSLISRTRQLGTCVDADIEQVTAMLNKYQDNNICIEALHTLNILKERIVIFNKAIEKRILNMFAVIKLLSQKYNIELNVDSGDSEKTINIFAELLLVKASVAVALSNKFNNFIFMQHTFECLNKVHQNREINLMSSGNLATILGSYILYDNKVFPESNQALDAEADISTEFPLECRVQVGSTLIKHLIEAWDKVAFFLPKIIHINMRSTEVKNIVHDTYEIIFSSVYDSYMFLTKLINIVYSHNSTADELYDIIFDDYHMYEMQSKLAGILGITKEELQKVSNYEDIFDLLRGIHNIAISSVSDFRLSLADTTSEIDVHNNVTDSTDNFYNGDQKIIDSNYFDDKDILQDSVNNNINDTKENINGSDEEKEEANNIEMILNNIESKAMGDDLAENNDDNDLDALEPRRLDEVPDTTDMYNILNRYNRSLPQYKGKVLIDGNKFEESAEADIETFMDEVGEASNSYTAHSYDTIRKNMTGYCADELINGAKENNDNNKSNSINNNNEDNLNDNNDNDKGSIKYVSNNNEGEEEDANEKSESQQKPIQDVQIKFSKKIYSSKNRGNEDESSGSEF